LKSCPAFWINVNRPTEINKKREMEVKEKMDTQSIVSKPEYASSEFSTEAPPVSRILFP
jgi:hypothetical protein